MQELKAKDGTPLAFMTSRLHTELWTSWASLLRSYAAAHGLNATQHAVVEVSAEEVDRYVKSINHYYDSPKHAHTKIAYVLEPLLLARKRDN